jgi:hypothetical protein
MTTQDTPAERQYEWVLFCPCGTRLAAPSEDDIVEVSFAHLREPCAASLPCCPGVPEGRDHDRELSEGSESGYPRFA